MHEINNSSDFDFLNFSFTDVLTFESLFFGQVSIKQDGDSSSDSVTEQFDTDAFLHAAFTWEEDSVVEMFLKGDAKRSLRLEDSLTKDWSL